MIKSDAPIMQAIYEEDEVEVSPERREFLAVKGRILYSKYCGTKGNGICAVSFAEYHVWRGEYVVVRDFLTYLDNQLAILHQGGDPQTQQQLDITENLVERIEALLGETVLEVEY
jgi:hypothetical protein